MTIYLTRHAHAGKRSLWEGDDRLRPISERGEAQASGLAARLGPDRPGRLMSSPYLRCIQTLEPLALHLGGTVQATEELAEGAALDTALELLLSLDELNGVACSHGDLIPPLLRALCEIGMKVDGPLIDQKGSLWIIETAAGRPVRGTYVPPTA